MKNILVKISISLLLLCSIFHVSAQNMQETMKIALVYKITNNIKWNTDTSNYLYVGLFSNNPVLISKFEELTKVAKINRQKLKLQIFTNFTSIKPVNLLYVDILNNSFLPQIFQQTSKQQTLVVTEEYPHSGEVMVNLKYDDKTKQYTFEYNRANILFRGLDLDEKIVLLKGSEIEIRELYLQAKKLWDEQKKLADSLKKQSSIQQNNILIQKDSLRNMKGLVSENILLIKNQNQQISQKDSIRLQLTENINQQQSEIAKNRLEILSFLTQQQEQQYIISDYKKNVNRQKHLSDSLSTDIKEKTEELLKKKKTLGEKETVIHKQAGMLQISFMVIIIVLVSTFLIFRSYLINKRAKQKIAEQKAELESTLAKLQNTQQQLIQSEKMASLGVLVAGVAHEINNPINFINSGVSGIEKLMDKLLILFKELDRLSPDSSKNDISVLVELRNKLKYKSSLQLMPEVIANIKMGVSRTIEITNGLRLYARMDKEEKSLHNINQIIETALLLIKSKLNANVQVVKQFEQLPETLVYPGKLSQVFVNLLSNSFDSIEERKTSLQQITIRTVQANNNITIEVEDTGKGIPQSYLDKLFDPFFTTKTVGKGTGLGLSISLGIIEEHSGRISAKNNTFGGATFTIEIPIITKI